MTDLLALPEIQTGAIPFLASLLSALVFLAVRPSWFVAGGLVGFYASAMAMGVFDLSPTRSVNRVLLLGIVFLVVAIGLNLTPASKDRGNLNSTARGALIGLVAAATCWLIWSATLRQGMPQALMTFLFAAAYAGWLIHMIASGGLDTLRKLSATCFLALSTGICVVLGASALLGQLAISMGVACGALLLIASFRKQADVDSTLIVPVVVVVTSLGVAGVVFAKVTWVTLLILAAIPLAVRLPVPQAWPRLAQSALISAFAVAVGGSASFLAWWQNMQSASYY